MIVLGTLSFLSVLALVWAAIHLIMDKQFFLGVIAVLFAIVCFGLTLFAINNPKRQEHKVIKCSEIERIDTLRKNDCIIGYEIVITE